jgi:hypothetical protein
MIAAIVVGDPALAANERNATIQERTANSSQEWAA